MFLYSPFEQFRIKELFYYDSYFIFTNAFLILFSIFISYFIYGIMIISTKKQKINISMRYLKIIYIFFYGLMRSYLGRNYINLYFPFLLYLFFFILICNLAGLIPWTFTLTSHFFLNIGLSSTIWIGVLILAIKLKGITFFHLFYPSGSSAVLIILLGVIELMSWTFRIFSLALRLVANMIAGHILINCLAFYIYNIVYSIFNKFSISLLSVMTSIFPLIGLIVLIIFEAGVALLQAYIFIVLSCIYINEVI